MRIMPTRRSSATSIAPVQVGLVLVALLAVACWPPPSGRLLLVPLSTAAGRGMIPALLTAGGRVVALGPVAGSVIVVSEAPGLRWAMIGRGILPIAGVGGCGTFAGRTA